MLLKSVSVEKRLYNIDDEHWTLMQADILTSRSVHTRLKSSFIWLAAACLHSLHLIEQSHMFNCLSIEHSNLNSLHSYESWMIHFKHLSNLILRYLNSLYVAYYINYH